MAIDITLTPITSLANQTTAIAAMAANNTAITNAFADAFALDGTNPNKMLNNLDMNNNQILNLPAPATVGSPLRLQDLNSFIGGGTISTIPSGGTTGEVLAKSSNADYSVAWINYAASDLLGFNNTWTGVNTYNAQSGAANAMLFNYGTSSSPLPVSTSGGLYSVQSLVYGTASGSSLDAYIGAFEGSSTLQAGSHGTAVGGVFQGFAQGTWTPGDANSGAMGVQGIGQSSSGGAIFGGNLVANSLTSASSSLIGLEIDVSNAVNGATNKYGLAINDDSTSVGTVTGTLTVASSLASILNSSAIMFQTVASSAGAWGWPFGILAVQTTASNAQPPVRSTGSFIRSGGYALNHFIDIPDLTVNGNLINYSNFKITGAGAVTAGAWNANPIGSAYGGTGVGNSSANTITFSGNYGLTLTLSGATSISLPASGTLTTLATVISTANSWSATQTMSALIVDSQITSNASSPGLLFQTSATPIGQIAISGGATYFDFDGSLNFRNGYNGSTVCSISSAGAITVPGGTSPILSTSSSVTSGAGSSTGTLSNAPAATNPTKWIPIDDNGTTRYIPAW